MGKKRYKCKMLIKLIYLVVFFLSEIGRYVRQAVHTPKLFQYLPRLLPLSAANLLLIGDEKLQEIETAISKCPWVFGFRQVNKIIHVY